MLLHASEDLFAGDGTPVSLGPLYSGFVEADFVRQDIFQAIVYTAMAVLIIVLTRFSLGRKTEATMTVAANQPTAAD